MSREIIDPGEDSVYALRGIEYALDRIADTLDDFIEMTFTAQAAATMRDDPQGALDKLLGSLAAIEARRKARADR